MKLKVFSLILDENSQLDDEEMQVELEGCEVLKVWEHFLTEEGVWVIMVGYRTNALRTKPDRQERVRESKRARQRLAEKLDPLEFEVFESLRRWRSAFAEERQTGLHLVLSNAQLVEVIKRNPTSIKDLREVKGIGESKAKDFGSSLLKALSEAWEHGQNAVFNRSESKEEG